VPPSPQPLLLRLLRARALLRPVCKAALKARASVVLSRAEAVWPVVLGGRLVWGWVRAGWWASLESC